MSTLDEFFLAGIIVLTLILIFVIAGLNQVKKEMDKIKLEISRLNGVQDGTRKQLDDTIKAIKTNITIISNVSNNIDYIESHMRRDYVNIKELSMLVSCIKSSSFSEYAKKDKEFQDNLRHLAKLAKHDN